MDRQRVSSGEKRIKIDWLLAEDKPSCLLGQLWTSFVETRVRPSSLPVAKEFFRRLGGLLVFSDDKVHLWVDGRSAVQSVSCVLRGLQNSLQTQILVGRQSAVDALSHHLDELWPSLDEEAQVLTAQHFAVRISFDSLTGLCIPGAKSWVKKIGESVEMSVHIQRVPLALAELGASWSETRMVAAAPGARGVLHDLTGMCISERKIQMFVDGRLEIGEASWRSGQLCFSQLNTRSPAGGLAAAERCCYSTGLMIVWGSTWSTADRQDEAEDSWFFAWL